MKLIRYFLSLSLIAFFATASLGVSVFAYQKEEFLGGAGDAGSPALKINDNLVAVSTTPTKGGVVRVIDSATGDIARTTSGWIEGSQYGWYAKQDTAAWSAVFDSSITRTGRLTLKLSNTNTSGQVYALNYNGAVSVGVSNQQFLIPLKASTQYKLKIYAKTNNVATNAVFAQVYMFKVDFTNSATVNGTSNKLSGTNDWTLLTATFTTNADCVWSSIKLSNDASGNISDAWFDVNSMTLEEVSTITAPSASLLYPKVTAVTSKDNIDQSQVNTPSVTSFGTNAQQYLTHSFTPTKKNFYGVTLNLKKVLSPTDNLIVTLEGQSSDLPNGTVYATYSIPATSLTTTLAEYTFILPYTISIQKYAFRLTRSGSLDDSNYFQIGRDNSTSYSGGLSKLWNGTAYASMSSWYFKTLYSKNTTNFTVRTDTQTLSVTAPTTDGWPDGTVIDTATLGVSPLSISAGVNNIYYSSNGPATADGTVDPSLQFLVTNNQYSSTPYFLNINSGINSNTININQ